MSIGMMKMWISFAALVCMFLAVGVILISRHKIQNRFLKLVGSIFAYVFVFIAGIMMIVVLM